MHGDVPDKFKGFREALRADRAPKGALEIFIVDEVIDFAWWKPRIPAYKTAVFSKQRDEAIKPWELEHPMTSDFDRWSAKQTLKIPAEQPLTRCLRRFSGLFRSSPAILSIRMSRGRG
jgi:hypothetical protein